MDRTFRVRRRGNGVNTKKLAWQLEQANLTLPAKVTKRNGSSVPFDMVRIARALTKCFEDLGKVPDTSVDYLAERAITAVAGSADRWNVVYGGSPSVEDIQDIVEMTLLINGEYEAAKAYILYRNARSQERGVEIPEDIQAAFDADKEYLPSSLQQFQFYDKYSRFNWDKGRRETWVETVDRAVDYLRWLSNDKLAESDYDEIHKAILNMEVMPSMRLLAMAGDAAKRNSLSIYNCSALPIIDIDAFAEVLLVSMAGCGVGFSVESHNVEKFPRVKRQKKHFTPPTMYIEDTTEGWADAVRAGLHAWWDGEDIEFDYSFIRPAGTVLLTKGGRASGPEPLRQALDFLKAKVLARQGSFIRTIDAHDMVTALGSAAVMGGVRRTAMISLFDWDDTEVRTCKNQDLIATNNTQRWNANNSAVWPETLEITDVVRQMLEMAEAGSGEPGIFSRANAVATKPKRRKKAMFQTNPCGEINLRPFGLCNLSSVIARQDDDHVSLMRKVRIATIIGTIQSLATHFPGMRPEWKQNAEDERLLGVDINGQMDCPAVRDADVMLLLRETAVTVNEFYAETLGINPSASITCVKPNGNSSQLVDCSSGLHRREAPFYLRRVRVGAATPIYRVLREAGVPMTPENGQTAANATTWVVAFPVKAPEGALIKQPHTAIEQLDYWLMVKQNYTEHNPSATINYDPDEIIDVTKWVWENRDKIGGLSFLPNSQVHYAQAPYEAITEEQYEAAMAAFPAIDFSLVYRYEKEDMTTAAQELACMAGACEV